MQLDPRLNIAPARDALNETGRATLNGLLSRVSLRRLTAKRSIVPRWNLVTRLGGKHIDLDAAGMAALPQAQKAEFHRRVEAEAKRGFQYLYETYPLYDKAHGGQLRRESSALAELFAFLNGSEFLTAMREVLDRPDIGFADAQVTCYRPGHFLSTHDDGIAGKNRVAAYVLSLTEGWHEDWGGQLEFYDDDGAVSEVFTPRCNTLSLFRVPVPHAVTPVLPRADRPRISITGWLRTGRDPGLDASTKGVARAA